jgi:hypothetical protein
MAWLYLPSIWPDDAGAALSEALAAALAEAVVVDLSSVHVSNTGTGDPPRGRGPGVALSSRLVRVVALRTALREALGSGLVNLIVMLVPATDAPHEGSGSAPI